MNLYEQYKDKIEVFLSVCHRLSANKYVTGFGGNLAWKLEENLLLITPTQMNKGDIGFSDVVFIDMQGKTVAGTRRPTGETPMYVNFFR